MENIFFTSLTLPEVRQIFRQELEGFFEEKQRIEPNSQMDPLLTIKDAAQFLSLSVPTIYSLVSRSQIPVNKRGKRLYFSKHELTEWIKAGRKKTVSELQEQAHAELLVNNQRRSL